MTKWQGCEGYRKRRECAIYKYYCFCMWGTWRPEAILWMWQAIGPVTRLAYFAWYNPMWWPQAFSCATPSAIWPTPGSKKNEVKCFQAAVVGDSFPPLPPLDAVGGGGTKRMILYRKKQKRNLPTLLYPNSLVGVSRLQRYRARSEKWAGRATASRDHLCPSGQARWTYLHKTRW